MPFRTFRTVRALRTFRTVHAHSALYARNNEKQHVKHNRPAIEFEEGDFVVIKNKDSTPDSNTKLTAKFKGPYVIHKRLPNDRYVIRDIHGCQLTQLPYDGVLESTKIRRWIVPLVGD